MRKIYKGGIYDVHVDNALTNGILIQFSKDIIVKDCVTSNTVVNNGLTVMELPLFNDDAFSESNDIFHNNIIIDSCESYGNKDVGFTTAWAIDVKFIDCYSHDNGNINGWNVGGGFSNESLGWSNKLPTRYSSIGANFGFDTNVIFEDCKSIDNYNYGFYCDNVDTIIKNCEIEGSIQTNSKEEKRKGNGIFSNTVKEGFIINGTSIKNCDNYAILLKNSSGEIFIKDTDIDNLKGIYLYNVANYNWNGVNIFNATRPMYLADGNMAKKAIISDLYVKNSSVVLLGNVKSLTVENLKIEMQEDSKEGSYAVAFDKVTSGTIKNSVISKGINKVSKRGIYLKSSVSTEFIANEKDNTLFY